MNENNEYWLRSKVVDLVIIVKRQETEVVISRMHVANCSVGMNDATGYIEITSQGIVYLCYEKIYWSDDLEYDVHNNTLTVTFYASRNRV